MTGSHIQMGMRFDGNDVVCWVPKRWLDQVASQDDFHDHVGYQLIAEENRQAIENAVIKKFGRPPSATEITLQRADFRL